jgi:hypothetical protein
MPSNRNAAAAPRREPNSAITTSEMLWAISPQNTDEAARSKAFRRLMVVAQRSPTTLLPHWGLLVGLLRSPKASSRYPAVHLIAALVPADRQGRFERIFSAYFSRLDDEALSVAAHVARLAGDIALARPALRPRITKRLLGLEKSHFDPGRRDLIKSYALQAFEEYYEESRSKPAMHKFAASLVASKSPKARKAAKAWLKKHGETPAGTG